MGSLTTFEDELLATVGGDPPHESGFNIDVAPELIVALLRKALSVRSKADG